MADVWESCSLSDRFYFRTFVQNLHNLPYILVLHCLSKTPRWRLSHLMTTILRCGRSSGCVCDLDLPVTQWRSSSALLTAWKHAVDQRSARSTRKRHIYDQSHYAAQGSGTHITSSLGEVHRVSTSARSGCVPEHNARLLCKWLNRFCADCSSDEDACRRIWYSFEHQVACEPAIRFVSDHIGTTKTQIVQQGAQVGCWQPAGCVSIMLSLPHLFQWPR